MKPVDIYLAAFLDTLDAQLNDLPPARRAEILGETREHLDAMMVARRADGMAENDAWHSARQAFGDAEAIGRELAREWERAPRVETVGTPLSKREKLILFARPVALSILVYGFFMPSMINASFKSYWVNGLLAVITFGCAGYGFKSGRRGGGKWTPATAFNWALCILSLLWANLHLTFGSQLRGTSWETISQNYPSVMLPLFLAASFWLKRETNTTLPWRTMPRYAQNPIAAEETFRLSPKIGAVMGLAMGCMGNLWMGWKFFGFGLAGMLCVGEIALAYLYARWLNSKTS